MPRPPSDPSVPSVPGFWDFVALRHAAWWRKRDGQGPPYSDNYHMAQNHWPNVFRELDRGTVYFHEQTTGRPVNELFFATVCYRLLNRQATFEKLGGIPTSDCVKHFTVELIKLVEEGERVFTNRHLVCGWQRYLEATMFASTEATNYERMIRNVSSLPVLFQQFTHIPGTGKFFAWQMCCDLLEAGVMPFSENDWCYLGPGPRSAFKMILQQNSVSQHECLRRTRWLVDNQEVFLENGPIPFRYPPNIPKLTLKNVEHGLCEYSRWVFLHWELDRVK